MNIVQLILNKIVGEEISAEEMEMISGGDRYRCDEEDDGVEEGGCVG